MQLLPEDLPDHIRAICEMVKVMLGDHFGAAYDDEQAARAAYQDHVDKVSNSYEETVASYVSTSGTAGNRFAIS